MVTWEFHANGVRPGLVKKNVLVALTDGQSVAKVTIYEEFSSKCQEGGSYFMRGYGLRGEFVPYSINISRETMFFRSGPIEVTPELRRQAESLICPPSPLTPLSSCTDTQGLFTVEGEVVQVSPVSACGGVKKGNQFNIWCMLA